MLCAMLLVSVVASGQANLLAYELSVAVVLEQPEVEIQIESGVEEVSNAIIVDKSSKEKVYPSLDEEMDMYLQLRSESPLAYFFPNPSNGIVWIEHNLGSDASVQIKDAAGITVFEAKKMKAKKLDLSEFEAGRYSIELVKGENRVIRGLKVI